MRSTLHLSSPQIFSLAVYRLRGDCKSPGFIGRTFFTADCKSAGTPNGRQPPDGSVRNPWSKNALLTQRNPMNKNIQVKSGLREFPGIMQKLFPYKKYQVGVQFLRWF